MGIKWNDAAGGNQTLGMVGLENRHGFERVLVICRRRRTCRLVLTLYRTSLIGTPMGQKKVVSEVSSFQRLKCMQEWHAGVLLERYDPYTHTHYTNRMTSSPTCIYTLVLG